MSEERPLKVKKGATKDVDDIRPSPLARLKSFLQEVQTEFGKIVWPGRKQTLASTAVVVVLVLILSLYLGAIDLLLGKLIGYILR